ncbi:MAG: hypothetical protein HC802_08540 [Caldilineaceae bacterium]|nr:hypothetical protein [Caldilineaceae bacterium]
MGEPRWLCGNDVLGLTLGIVGMGAIGRRVAELATAFGMRVAYWNRSPLTLPYQALALDDLLQQADVVTLHVALTEETHRLIGAQQLARMKPGALLVNTARGAVVDEVALRVALQSGRLAGFAADVLEAEPPLPNDPLLADPRALITPHVAALTAATYRAMCLRTARNVLAVLAGQEPEAAALFDHAAHTERK